MSSSMAYHLAYRDGYRDGQQEAEERVRAEVERVRALHTPEAQAAWIQRGQR